MSQRGPFNFRLHSGPEPTIVNDELDALIDDDAPRRATVARLAQTVAAPPQVRCQLFTEDGHVWLHVRGETWIDDLTVLLTECERAGAPVRGVRVDLDAGRPDAFDVMWTAPGWGVRASRAERRLTVSERNAMLDAALQVGTRQAVRFAAETMAYERGGSVSEIVEDEANARIRVYVRGLLAVDRLAIGEGLQRAHVPAGVVVDVFDSQP